MVLITYPKKCEGNDCSYYTPPALTHTLPSGNFCIFEIIVLFHRFFALSFF